MIAGTLKIAKDRKTLYTDKRGVFEFFGMIKEGEILVAFSPFYLAQDLEKFKKYIQKKLRINFVVKFAFFSAEEEDLYAEYYV